MDIGRIRKIIEVKPEHYPATQPVPHEPSPKAVPEREREEPVPV